MPALRRIAQTEDFQKRCSGWRITRRGDPITSLFYLVTSFTKIVIVLGLLRQAMGLQQVPPNMVLNGLAMILTVYVMAPVGMDVGEAVQDKLKGGSNVSMSRVEDAVTVYNAATHSVRGFLMKHSTERDRRFFLNTAGKLWPAERAKALHEDDLLVLIPSFTVSELTAAFRIGFVIYIAFVMVDLIVANILLALGMVMVAPTIISAPFKLLLFVVLDGWARLAQGLVLSYQ
jgi:type III secretion protein R